MLFSNCPETFSADLFQSPRLIQIKFLISPYIRPRKVVLFKKIVINRALKMYGALRITQNSFEYFSWPTSSGWSLGLFLLMSTFPYSSVYLFVQFRNSGIKKSFINEMISVLFLELFNCVCFKTARLNSYTISLIVFSKINNWKNV